MLVSGGQRSQTLHSLNRDDIIFLNDNTLYVPIMAKIKQSKPGNHMKLLKFIAYPYDEKLCAITILENTC